jgi:hypothetical protein
MFYHFSKGSNINFSSKLNSNILTIQKSYLFKLNEHNRQNTKTLFYTYPKQYLMMIKLITLLDF